MWALWVQKLKAITKHLKKEFEVYRLVLKHPDTPMISKVFLGFAIGYLLLPFDLIPDFIPLLGQLDDVVIIPLLVWLALQFIHPSIIENCRNQLNNTI